MKSSRRLLRRAAQKKKMGTAFEECVAGVCSSLSPDATVTHSTWVEGPDGRRDQDVLIVTTVDGKPFRTIIECKDYLRPKTGPVGIGLVDALESKARDLKYDLAIVCCNAGFTEDAKRKALRVGIVLIGIVREGDSRIRQELFDFIYFRRLKIERLGVRLDCVRGATVESCMDIMASFGGAPAANWVCHFLVDVIMTNPIGAGDYAGTFRFRDLVPFQLQDGSIFQATSIFAEMKLTGGWFEQIGTIDGSAGVYDYLRRRIKVGAGAFKVQYKNLDLTKGTPISHPPRSETDIRRGTASDEFWAQLLYIVDCNCKVPVPPLHLFIESGDLDRTVIGLPPELTRDGKPKSFQFSVSRNPKVGPNHSFTWNYEPPTEGNAESAA